MGLCQAAVMEGEGRKLPPEKGSLWHEARSERRKVNRREGGRKRKSPRCTGPMGCRAGRYRSHGCRLRWQRGGCGRPKWVELVGRRERQSCEWQTRAASRLLAPPLGPVVCEIGEADPAPRGDGRELLSWERARFQAHPSEGKGVKGSLSGRSKGSKRHNRKA